MSRATTRLAALLLLALAGPAAAALGDNEASVAADQVKLKATRRIVAAPLYTVHEIRQASGTVVREYVSAQGQVFAVVWQGPRMPDLQQLLGNYFADYRAAAAAKRAGRGLVRLRQPGLVLHSGGHMRAFFGQAYIPQLLPAGVAIDEIR
ncbi:hypothetical protein GALL_266720 [mine drainage metagenome]|uniref:DUF2844 domain-containing protein n=1 Tax=mine drainage metagenome TaxID=410659 RepID=A0A1J5R610_9ZZZZ